MPRAPKVCAHCPHLMPCPTHTPKAWAGSSHRQRTLSGSREQKRARYILDRDSTICHVCGEAGADQADHVIPLAEGGPDTVDNMAAIHARPCHQAKTQAEAQRARHT